MLLATLRTRRCAAQSVKRSLALLSARAWPAVCFAQLLVSTPVPWYVHRSRFSDRVGTSGFSSEHGEKPAQLTKLGQSGTAEVPLYRRGAVVVGGSRQSHLCLTFESLLLHYYTTCFCWPPPVPDASLSVWPSTSGCTNSAVLREWNAKTPTISHASSSSLSVCVFATSPIKAETPGNMLTH